MKTLGSINSATRFLVAVSVLFFAGSAANAQTSPAKPTDDLSAAHKYFTDTELITQDGKPVRFYTDVLKGKVVVINCFFATCQGSCPVMSRTFSKLQQMLDERAVKDVVFVSITVDPELDTPERLKKYAATMGARPGWLLLTGTRANVDFIHKKLGQYVEEKADHRNIIIIGNEPTGLWKKAFGLAKPDELYAVLETVVNNK
ncbi:MAG: SCO family protein [Acidobacteriota bacterium]|nr:SCO family protein [Acidobacteriota bacterium]